MAKKTTQETQYEREVRQANEQYQRTEQRIANREANQRRSNRYTVIRGATQALFGNKNSLKRAVHTVRDRAMRQGSINLADRIENAIKRGEQQARIEAREAQRQQEQALNDRRGLEGAREGSYGLSTEETRRLQELKSTNPEAYNREVTRLANQTASQQATVTVSDSLKRGL